MCPISGWIGCALCLCASLVVCAQDHTEEDDMILEMILDDGLQAEAGDAPSAQFLKCNKVRSAQNCRALNSPYDAEVRHI